MMAVPTPIPNVASRTSSAPGTSARRIPEAMRIATLSTTPPRVPKRAATGGPASANSPMQQTGIAVSRPTNACDGPNSAST